MSSDVVNHSTDNGFQFGTVVKSVTMNNIVDAFRCIYIFIFVGYIPGSVFEPGLSRDRA